MALSASTIWEVETTGDDTNNGGAFDPSQTAGMFTDGAATSANTSAPVFTSASYNFAAGDVGAWVYISSGTNWTAGWYKIASVASNAATLTGTIGQGVLKTTLVPTTVVGCATVASPTSATWTIDYSQQAAARYAYTDLASAGTGLTVSSAAKPFAKEQVGNSIVVTGGTNFNAGRYVIASVASGTATVVGPTNITTGAGLNGTGGQGGALASLGKASSVINANAQTIFVATGTYSVTSATANVSAGCWNIGLSAVCVAGYGSVRDRAPLGQSSPPTMQLNVASATLDTGSAASYSNIIFDGNAQTSAKMAGATGPSFRFCTFNNFRAASSGNQSYFGCYATGNSVAIFIGTCINCVATANTATPFKLTPAGTSFIGCLSYGNTNSADGFDISQSGGNAFAVNCSAYNNARYGFYSSNANAVNSFINCIAEGNTTNGFNVGLAQNILYNCAIYNNTNSSGTAVGLITLTASPFTNAAGGDFSLNNAAGGGALCRAAGFPGTFPAGTSVGYLDIGAVQHKGGGGPFGMMGVM